MDTAEPASPFAVETQIRVRYAETDAMGVAHHSNHLVWFEAGRTEYTRAIGMPYRAIEESGMRLVVVAASCRYYTPTRYDDVIIVRTWVREITRATLTFSYDVRHAGSGRLLAEGETSHAATDLTGRVRRIPDPVRTALVPEGRSPSDGSEGEE
ncbi:MAG TPA: thioesterase family protein [bacterium]|nr:thioesterase family protein [bacterium]